MKSRVSVVVGDITRQKVDAIVNAANSTLLGGGGVDGAIHRVAGPELVWECRKLNGCATGSARITKGYNLPNQHVIHAVGPIWRGGKNSEADLLARAYRSCFALVEQYDIKSVAVPSISTGAYRFPIDQAARIAVTTAHEFCLKNYTVEKIIFVCYDQAAYDIYVPLVAEIIGTD